MLKSGNHCEEVQFPCSFHKIQHPSLGGHLFDGPKCLFTAMCFLEYAYTVLRGLIRFTGWGMATFVTSFNAECSVLKGHEFPSGELLGQCPWQPLGVYPVPVAPAMLRQISVRDQLN